MPAGYAFEVLASSRFSSELNEPITFVGGYVFVPAGLFLTARDSAEFAAMLAHAMAHLAGRHGMRQADRSRVANTASIPLIYMGGWAAYGQGSLVPSSVLRSMREDEIDADRLAVAALDAAGYEAGALRRYISRTQKGTQSEFSPLPDKAARLAAMPEVAGTGHVSDSDFMAVQESVRALVEPPRRVLQAPTLRRPSEVKLSGEPLQ
jgi:predicted Zn-dependent protease